MSHANEIKKRIDMDLHSRSITGILVYAFMLPAVFGPFDFFTLQAELSIKFSVAMLIISVLRLFFWFNTESLYLNSGGTWRFIFYSLSTCHACILSTFFFFAIYDEDFNPVLNVSMLAIGGITSSALLALTPRIQFALANVAILMVPSIIGGLLIEGKLPFAIMILVYMIFICFVGIRSHREYLRSFDIETQLEKQKLALEDINKTDALTGINNRGFFNIEYKSKWQHACRHQIDLALVFIDIDHFKKLNDLHGHLVGDKCIIQVAQLIKTHFTRDTDLVARYGGEEFVVLLMGCSLHDATRQAEALCRRIENAAIVLDQENIDLTASVGVATTQPHYKIDPYTLLNNADKALYKAKNMGRNQVCVSDTNNKSV